jgi:hypothetical protein
MNTTFKFCCRYTYTVIPKTSIKECLENNPWLFNNSYFFYSYYNNPELIPEHVFMDEKNFLTENMAILSGASNSLDDVIDEINWNEFGTWYINQYPTDVYCDKSMVIGTKELLQAQTGNDFIDYEKLNDQWKFIHQLNPDIFITKHKRGILIGALNEYNIWAVEMPEKILK